ncbi:MAG: hypothetical protein N838_17105 [Thiohalocapsa sp. PB-PSB1]|nr:MAG: hypothetical protein N838_17105 [Thiohalocapsa sp. PB-PSB1]
MPDRISRINIHTEEAEPLSCSALCELAQPEPEIEFDQRIPC